MKLSIRNVVAPALLVLFGCTAAQERTPAPSPAAFESVYTDLGASNCRKVPDLSDPNETPYTVCPGIAGYSLIVRRVDAGRKSVDVVNAEGKPSPLRYQETVTRHMYTLDNKAEWRVAMRDGKQFPIAIIVRLHAREDYRRPARVTNTYVAVAKITPAQTCVTDSIREGAKPDVDIRSVADSAQNRPCAPPQPPLTDGGKIVR